MIPTVLILNHKTKECGVYQFGKRVYDLIARSKRINFIYREIDTLQEYLRSVKYQDPQYIVYNYHSLTMPWLGEDIIANDKKHTHCFIWHDQNCRRNFDAYLFFGDHPINHNKIPADKSILLPRPLLVYKGEYRKNEVFTIGSFGFGSLGKFMHILTRTVNNTFDKAVLNLHIPIAAVDHTDQAKDMVGFCRSENDDGKIQLNITQDFMSEEDLLKFLAGNDINVFPYKVNCDGLSSTIDYALSVKRPIAISESNMFRHIAKDEIMLEKHSIMEIYQQGIKPLEDFYNKWSINNFKSEFVGLFTSP